MEQNMAKLPFKGITDAQFLSGLLPIVEHALFVDCERLLALLATDADRDTLTESFRECFEGYYYDVAFELDSYETRLLSILDASDTHAALKHRVAIVQRKRRASPTGREVRRMGAFLPTDSLPEIKVSALSNHAFREFLHTLVKSEFFAAQARVVKLLNQGEGDAADTSLYEATAAEAARLQEAIYEFFVCHLEFEQFLEDYEYDPDEGLEIQPEVAEELEQSIADHKSGRVIVKSENKFTLLARRGWVTQPLRFPMCASNYGLYYKGTPLQEVAKTFGVNLKCTHWPLNRVLNRI